jgi:hypothetical protein
MLLRLEARIPLRAHGFRVAPDHLARLIPLMGQQHPTPASVPAATVTVSERAAEVPTESGADAEIVPDGAIAECHADGDTAESCDGTGSTDVPSDPHVIGETEPPTLETVELTQDAVEREKVRPRSDLLRQFDQAPLRLRCFGTRGVWHGERQIWPSSEAVEDTGWELVLLLGVHPVAGIQAETLADTIWDEETPPDPGSVLRKRRRRLRQELKRLIPELDLDPMPTDPKGRAYRLDPRVIASDVHQFVELAAWAKSLSREEGIDHTRRHSRCTAATCSKARPFQPTHGSTTVRRSPPRCDPITVASTRMSVSAWLTWTQQELPRTSWVEPSSSTQS